MRRPRKRLEAPEKVAVVLDRAGDDRRAPQRAPISRSLWELAVGPQIASRTQPISLAEGVLLVRTATSAWAHELSFLQKTLVDHLAERGLAVREVRFRVGAIDPPLRPPPERERVRTVPRAEPLPHELAVTIAQVADDELRETVAACARASLAYSRRLSEAQRGARDPRDAGKESARPARIGTTVGEVDPRTPEGARGRSR